MADDRCTTIRTKNRGVSPNADDYHSTTGGCSGNAAGDCSSSVSNASCKSCDTDEGSSDASLCDTSRSLGRVPRGARSQMGSTRRISADSSSSMLDGSCRSSGRERREGSTADADSNTNRLVCNNYGGGSRTGDTGCNSSSNPGTRRHAGSVCARWSPCAVQTVWLGAVVVLLLGTLNQVVGKIRAKALGHFDSVVAISNALVYTVVYFVLMQVLLWTKHIPRENISFVWSTMDGNNASASTPEASAACASAATDTEEQQRQGLRAPLLRPQHPQPHRQQQQAEADGAPRACPPASAAAGGGRRRGIGAWPWLVVTGCCDACGNILGFLAQPYVPGPYFVMALQAIVPFSCLCSVLLLKRRYTCYHLLALLLVLTGVLLPVIAPSRHAATPTVSVSAAGRVAAEQQVAEAIARADAEGARRKLGYQAKRRAVARRRVYSTATGKATAAAASSRGPHRGGMMRRTPTQQAGDSSATAGASGAMFQEVAEAAAPGDSARHSVEDEALTREQEDAAPHHEEGAGSTWDVSNAVLSGASADKAARIDSHLVDAATATATRAVAFVGCVNCAAHAGEKDHLVHASTGATDLPENDSPVLSHRSGDAGALDAPAIMRAADCLRRTQTHLRTTSQKTIVRRSNVHSSRRLREREGKGANLSKTSRSVFTDNCGALKNMRASAKKGEEGVWLNSDENARARVEREEAASEAKVKLSHAVTDRQSRSDGSAMARGASADARRVSGPDTDGGTERTTGEGRSNPALRPAFTEKVVRSETNRINGKPSSGAGREEKAWNNYLPAAEFAEVINAADGTRFAAGAAAELRDPFPKNTKLPTQTEAPGIPLWLYICLAALSTFPTALSFAIKEKLMQQYEQLHAAECLDTAGVAGGDTAAARVVLPESVEVRAVGVATLIRSEYSSASGTDTALEEQSGWSSGSSREDGLLRMLSPGCLPSRTQGLLRLYSGDTQVSSPLPAVAAVEEAIQLERPVSNRQRDRWTEQGVTSNSSSGGAGRRGNSGWDGVGCQSTEDTSRAATKREGTSNELDGAHTDGGSAPDTRALIDQMAAECLEEEEGAEATVLMGGGAVPPTPEAPERYSRSSCVSGFERHAHSTSVSARSGDLTNNRKPGGRLHVIAVCAHCSVFQLFWALAALPLSSWLGQTNNQSIPEFAVNALRCFAGSSTAKDRNDNSNLLFVHNNSVSDTDLCPYALRAYAVYVVINIVFNLSLIGFVARASSLLSFITLKATLPLGILFYALIPWPLLETHDVTVDASVFVCLALILSGVMWFHWESLRCRRRFESSSVTGNPPCCWPLRMDVLLRCIRRGLRCGVNCLEMCWTWGETWWLPRGYQPRSRTARRERGENVASSPLN